MTKNKALPTNETNSTNAVSVFVILDGNNSIKNNIVEARAIVRGETVRDNIYLNFIPGAFDLEMFY